MCGSRPGWEQRGRWWPGAERVDLDLLRDQLDSKPVTATGGGRKLYLRESTTDEAEAEARHILRRLTAQVDAQRHAKTNATFRVAMDARGCGPHEVEETTRTSYEQYARAHLFPAFGDQPGGKVTTQLLEEFYGSQSSIFG